MPPREFSLEASSGDLDHPYQVLEGNNEHPYHVLEGNNDNPYHVLEGNNDNPYHVLEGGPEASVGPELGGYNQPGDALSTQTEATGNSFNLLDQANPGGGQHQGSGSGEVPTVIVEGPDQEIIEMVVPEEEQGPGFAQSPFFGWFQGDGPQNHNMDMINSLNPEEQFQALDPSTMEADEVFDQPVSAKRQIKRSKPVSGQKPDIKKRT